MGITMLKGLVANKARAALTAVSIALGVSFLAGTLLLTTSMERDFRGGLTSVNSGTDVLVRGSAGLGESGPEVSRRAVPADLRDRVRAVPGVAVAEGVVEGYAVIASRAGRPVEPASAPTTGGNLPTDAALRGGVHIRMGRLPEAADEVTIDASSATEAGLEVGSVATMYFQGPSEQFRVVGVVGFGGEDNLGGSSSAFFTLETAQRVLGKADTFDHVVIRTQEGTSPDSLADSLRAVLAADHVEVITGEELQRETSQAVGEDIDFLRTSLLAFAAVALLVSAFIIWNTFSMQVAQRSRELALLRAIGATQRQVVAVVLGEAMLIGVLASGVGVLLGVAMAHALPALMSAFGTPLSEAAIRLTPEPVAAALAVGTTVTLIAAAGPSRRATRVSPMEALRDAAPSAATPRRSRRLGGPLMLTAGAAGMAATALGDAPAVWLALGSVCAVMGVAAVLPSLVQALMTVSGPVLSRAGIAAELAGQNALRSSRRTAATAMTLVIGLALVAAVSVFAASLKASFDGAITSSARADLYVMTPLGRADGLGPDVLDALKVTDGVAITSAMGAAEVRAAGAEGSLASVDPATVDDVLDLDVVGGSGGDLTPTGVLVFKDTAEERGLHVGHRLPVVFPSAQHTEFEVQGVFENKAFLGADYVITTADHDRFMPDRRDNKVLVRVEAGSHVSAVKHRVEGALGVRPDADVMDLEELQDEVGGAIDGFLALVTALLFLALIIALLGIVNTLALSVFERTREIGLLRAVGMSRGQVRTMIRWESALISTIGAALGMVLGLVLGMSGAQALADEGMDVPRVPLGQLLLYVCVAIVAGVLAAVGPARRAARVDVLRAVAAD